jgi:hypothetical protein
MFTAFPEMGCGVKLFTGTNANGEWTPADAAKAKAQPATGCHPTDLRGASQTVRLSAGAVEYQIVASAFKRRLAPRSSCFADATYLFWRNSRWG